MCFWKPWLWGSPLWLPRVGGAEELIEDGVTGLLVSPFDEGALAEAINNILTRGGKRKELGEMAKEKARRRFPLELMVEETEKLYMKLLNLNYSNGEKNPAFTHRDDPGCS